MTDYEAFIVKKVRKKHETYNMDALFKKPLIHRQILGDKVFIPLDTKRLWGY